MKSRCMMTTSVMLALAMATPALAQRDQPRIADAFDQQVWQQRDANNDGKLTWREYVQDTTEVREVIIRKRLFTRADEDGDGEVTRQEAAQFSQNLPGQPGDNQGQAQDSIELSDQELAALQQAFDQQNFQQWDRDNDNALSVGEFIAAAERPGDIDERRRLFRLVDIDNNNQVTRFEVQQVLQSGIGNTVMLPIVVDIFNLRDRDNNRDLSREEFLAGLSGDALAAAQRGFKVIDRNDSGTISPRELDSFLLGRPGVQSQDTNVVATPRTDEPATPPTQPAAQPQARRGSDTLRRGWLQSFDSYDHDNDGVLTLEELTGHYKGEQAQQARQTFYADDRNFDGKLTQQELRAGLHGAAGNE